MRRSSSHPLRTQRATRGLVLHGEADEVVPLEEGQALFERAAEPKRFVPVPGARHLDAVMSRVGRAALLEFFDECLRP